MKIEELIGKNILKAYDGNYLSHDFGYSCANFNVGWSEDDNDEATFEFYTENRNNISCFVCYNEEGKICGRRMFFKGPSMINDEEFDVPVKRGEIIHYLYGYYGTQRPGVLEFISRTALEKYGKDLLYTDRFVLKKGRPNNGIKNLWVMGVERTDFKKYPPVDALYVSTELNALSNFPVKKYVIEILERDFNKKDVEFEPAYRFVPGRKKVRYNYKTWFDHHGTPVNPEDYTTIIEEEEDEEVVSTDIKPGDTVVLLNPDGAIYIHGKDEFSNSALGRGTELGKVETLRVINGVPCVEILGNGNLYRIKNVKKI
jgi:hypothetical protein